MDGLTLAASVIEMHHLIGGKIEKIRQPDKYELLFDIHAQCGKRTLLISASPDNCRIHETMEKRTSPVEAPMFLMLLRKHLLNARITDIEQANHDRIVIFKFNTLTELQDKAELSLVCEIMGRHSNIILVGQDGVIIDAIRRVSAGMSSVRLILPRVGYVSPPTQQKKDPILAGPRDFEGVLSGTNFPEKALSAAFYGLSPRVAAVLLQYLNYDSSNIQQTAERLEVFYKRLDRGMMSASIVKAGETELLLPFTPFALESETFKSIGEAADKFYRMRSEGESIKRRTGSIERIIQNNIQRIERKIDKFNLAVGDEAEIEKLKLFGELLTANMYSIPARCKEAAVLNYYANPPEKIAVPLDEQLSPADNAQLYYKKYRKAKVARDTAGVQLEEALAELKYLKGIEIDLQHCSTDSDLDEIKTELVHGGYIRDNFSKRVKLPRAKPHSFISSDGIEILVGKNNTQNDKLTFKESSPGDMWLHTKDIHGSHVIIRETGEIPAATLNEAGCLAAYFSQAKNSSAVPVDYARRKFVKKPSGAKPGMVVYTNQKTMYITPDKAVVEGLEKNGKKERF